MRNFKNINLSKKLFLSYVLLIAIPLFISCIILENMSYKNLKTNTLYFTNLFVEQISSNADNFIDELDRLINVACLDETLCQILTSDYPVSTSKSFYNEQFISKYMLNLISQHSIIKNITIIGKHGKVFSGPSNTIVSKTDFTNVLGEKISSNSKELNISPAYFSKHFLINYPTPIFTISRNLFTLDSQYIGTIFISCTCEDFMKKIDINYSLLQNEGRIILKNSNNEVLLDTSPKFNQTLLEHNASITTISNTHSDNSLLSISATSEASKLTTTFIVNQDKLFYSISRFDIYSILIILTVLSFSVILSLFFNKYLVTPIIKLQKSTELFADGNLDIHLNYDSQDEIGKLYKSFNNMTLRIKYLLESVYIYKLQNKQAQLEALQNQINPHFLHNTLESIRMKALLNNDKEVAQMIKNLSKLFRITLERRHNTVSILEELEHVKIYMQIINMRFNNRFALHIQIPDEYLNCSIIKLCLQPLVENCITHGFKDIFENEQISIVLTRHNDDIFLDISDNGVGIKPDILLNILDKIEQKRKNHFSDTSTKSIGIYNIAERISLKYGSDYSLSIHPVTPHGTKITLKIPLS